MAILHQGDNSAAPVHEQDDLAAEGESRGEEVFQGEPRPDIWELRAGVIGRGHAGKTSLFRAMSEGPVGDFFPSGLHVDVGDPREVAQMIREAVETQRILQASGLPPTLEASQIRYYLYDGDRQRVVYKMREVIGQVLTHTLPDSSAEQQSHYDEYIRTLVNTHVLWAVVPCLPPNPSARDRRRYSNDLRITSAYLREALRLRTSSEPVSVALVLSKIDILFKDPDEARSALTDDVLRNALGPLAHLVGKSTHVSDAVILPVTAFGFDNATLREQVGGPEASSEVTVPEDPFGAEPTWLLKEGAAPRPFNLDTLVVWTLLFGLLNQDAQTGREGKAEIGELCQMLRDDLSVEDRWFLTLKSRQAQG